VEHKRLFESTGRHSQDRKMKAKHPAWRLVLALKSNGLDPQELMLPAVGGCESWNQVTEKLARLMRLDLEESSLELERLLQDEEYMVLYGAYRIFKLSEYRVQLETLLLSGVSNDEVESVLHVNRDTLHAYIDAFFDTSVFETHTDRHEYVAGIQDLAELDVKSNWEKGLDYLKWTMGIGSSPDAKTILTSLLNETYFRYKGASDRKEAMKLCDNATKLADKLVELKDADMFMEDIHLALDLTEPVFEPVKK
jgi:hypothetical protein